MLNIVTGPEDYPAAILIRGVGKFNGPGKLTKALKVNRVFNNLVVGKPSRLWFEDRGKKVLPGMLKKSPRIGVDYAGPVWSKKLYRYTLVNR